MAKLKLFYLDKYNRDKWNTNDYAIRFCHGYDILVHFPDEDYYELTTDPLEAEAVVLSCSTQYIDAKIDPDSNPLIKSLEIARTQFPNLKLFYDTNHLYHMGPGCSSVDKTELAEDFFEFLYKTRKIAVLSLHTNLGVDLLKKSEGIENENRFSVYTEAIFNRVYSFYKHQPDRIFKASMETNSSNSWYPNRSETMRKESFELTDLDNTYRFVNPEDPVIPNNAVLKSFISANRIRYPDLYYSELTNFSDISRSYEKFGQTPHRVPQTRDFLRADLTKLLYNYPGFLGDPSKGNFLIGHKPSQEDLEATLGFQGACSIVPFHHSYYYHSVLTIGIETNINQMYEGFALTEKTFEPFLKGHIPLMFSSPGFYHTAIEYYGFKMPDWVNLRFDDYFNDLDRWMYFVLEVKRLLNLGPKELHRLRLQDVDILRHNRSILLDHGYKKPISQLTDRFLQNIDRQN